MGDAAVGSEYGKMDPPNTGNPGSNFEANAPNFDGANENLKNPESQLILDAFDACCLFFQTYGWFIVFATVLCIVIWTNIRHLLYSMLDRLRNQASTEKYKDPQLVQNRLEAMERSRLRMQAKYEEESREKLEKIRQREEQKRIEAIEDHDALKAGKSQASTLRRIEKPDEKSSNPSSSNNGLNKERKPLRQSDYNPLTGTSNSGARYRPSSRRPTAGG